MNILPLVRQFTNVDGGWVGTIEATSNSYTSFDSNGNLYVLGGSGSGDSSYSFLAKFNTTGVLQWQRKLDGTYADNPKDIKVDSSGNIYIILDSKTTATSTSNRPVIAKYNSSGVLQWQKIIKDYYIGGYNTCHIDSENNIYIGLTNNVFTEGYVVKIDSTGKRLSFIKLTTIQSVSGIATDSSGNIYVTGRLSSDFSQALVKLSSAGQIQWQKSVNLTGGGRVAADSSGNSYLYVNYTTADPWQIFVLKYDTTGTLVWDARLTDPTSTNGHEVYCNSIYLSSDNKLYITGASKKLPDWRYYTDILVASIDTSSGTILWQNKLQHSSDNCQGLKITADTTSVYISGFQNTSNIEIVAKMPNTGSIPGTGSYLVGTRTYTYIPNTLTYSGTGYTQSTPAIVSTYYDTVPSVFIFGASVSLTANYGYLKKDSSENIYTLVDTDSSTNSYVAIYKLDVNGTILWQRKLDTASADDSIGGFQVTSSGTVYVLLNNGSNVCILVKYDANGTLIWKKQIGTNASPTNLKVSDTEHLYVCGVISASPYYGFYVKYDSNGNVIWQKTSALSGTTTGNSFYFGVDSSNNVLAANTNGISKEFWLHSYSSDLSTLNWRVQYNRALTSNAGYTSIPQIITTDSAGNIYVAIYYGYGTYVVKFNASGVLQWTSAVGDMGSTYGRIFDITIDTDGSIYLTFYQNLVIIKLNSSGAKVWERKFTGLTPKAIVCVTGYIMVSTDRGILKLPNDGTIPGSGSYSINGGACTYVNSTYGASLVTSTASTPGATITFTTTAETNNNATITDAALSFTSSVDSLVLAISNSTLTDSASSLVTNSLNIL